MISDTQPAAGEQTDAAEREPTLRASIGRRLLIADGAMGSMLQGIPTTLDDFDGQALAQSFRAPVETGS